MIGRLQLSSSLGTSAYPNVGKCFLTATERTKVDGLAEPSVDTWPSAAALLPLVMPDP